MREKNLSVYGADKIWDQLNEDGIRVACCTVERLMPEIGIRGSRQSRVFVRTTVGDDRQERPADLVERQFRAAAPNQLWVARSEMSARLPMGVATTYKVFLMIWLLFIFRSLTQSIVMTE